MRRRGRRSGWWGSVILCRPFQPNCIGAADATIAPITAMLSMVLLMSLTSIGLNQGLAIRVVARTWGVISAGTAVARRLCRCSSVRPALDAIAAYKPAARYSASGVDGHAKSSGNRHSSISAGRAFARGPFVLAIAAFLPILNRFFGQLVADCARISIADTAALAVLTDFNSTGFGQPPHPPPNGRIGPRAESGRVEPRKVESVVIPRFDMRCTINEVRKHPHLDATALRIKCLRVDTLNCQSHFIHRSSGFASE